MNAETKIIRFDVELTNAEFEQFGALCEKCYRSRKNFAEALIKLVIDCDGPVVMLDKLGIIPTKK